MTNEDFYCSKALEGGYKGIDVTKCDKCGNFEQRDEVHNVYFDYKAWKAVGKALNWDREEFKKNMHEMVDNLIRGNSLNVSLRFIRQHGK